MERNAMRINWWFVVILKLADTINKAFINLTTRAITGSSGSTCSALSKAESK